MAVWKKHGILGFSSDTNVKNRTVCILSYQPFIDILRMCSTLNIPDILNRQWRVKLPCKNFTEDLCLDCLRKNRSRSKGTDEEKVAV